ncbi:hypothetical protein SAMN04488065_1723 [Haloplanus vescus]|uniref:Uncharacterized protein n=1 Tax=Haloplanus vescus TaxID=555874 RepID=A0A1H3Y8H1_9EURY|nr:hypothetical protein [Haloplanus vescus]SEA07873.1 hypothetical protein SAMN04488065_1723 [Haloplanus vescus]
MASFFDRFVHPRLARVATAGAALWAGSFLVAAVGLGLRGTAPTTSGTLFFLSGLTGLGGMVVLGLCGLWLLGVRAKQMLG